MPSVPPSPKLSKSVVSSKAQATVTRLAALVPTLTTQFSPVTVYQPALTVVDGSNWLLNTTLATGGIGAPPLDIPGFYGVWVAPDLNNGEEYYVQVECFAAGGGGGGGNASVGGGGGGGGGYSCEDAYPVIPGSSYAWVVGLPGTGGLNCTQASPGSAGSAGGATTFDTAGVGLAGGVVAYGGGGGDAGQAGTGGAGGVISGNTISFAGGAGGSGASSYGSDNPIALAAAPGCFAGGGGADVIQAWYILNDGPDSTFEFNDSSSNYNTAKVTNYRGGVHILQAGAPPEVPAYASAASPPYQPNPTEAGVCSSWEIGSLSSASGVARCPSFGFAGGKITISCWVKPDPSGTWGNTARGSVATIAANSANYNTSAFTGYGLFLRNDGSASSPTWNLYFNVGNSSASNYVSTSLPPTPGTWYYIVATFNGGAIDLYVNGTLADTVSAVGFTSLPGGSYATAIGMSPAATANWFFGSVSNIWFAEDAATTTLLASVWGPVSPTGGSGGGASGGPSAAGGAGASASGTSGGAGGTPAAQPAALAGTTTPAAGGFEGATAGSSARTPPLPPGGSLGGGGSGSGNQAGSPVVHTMVIPFASAATYAGQDAATGAGAIYNVNQQSNPASSLNSVLYAGGLPADSASGSKISVLLLPSNFSSILDNVTNGNDWVINQIFLTFTNANPSSAIETILEVGCTTDTSLPSSYIANYVGQSVAALPVPVGSGTLTYDITMGGLVGQNAGMESADPPGRLSALFLGPMSSPTIDAYNAPSGADFYAAVYGPGAADTSGNSQAPYLTLVFTENTPVPQQGSNGDGGGIVISYIDPEAVPVAAIEPYATTDADGNQFAEGYTGPVTAFSPIPVYDPTTELYVSVPEIANDTVGVNSFTCNPSGFPGLQYWLGADNMVHVSGCVQNPSNGGPTGTTFFTLPSEYWPVSARMFLVSMQAGLGGSPPDHIAVGVDASGNMQIHNIPAGTTLAANSVFYCEFSYPSKFVPNIH